jgi:hypothetical protein
MREVVERIDAAWRSWLKALDRVDPTRREDDGVCGYWSVKDLVAHLALWDRVVTEHVQRWQLGLVRYPYEVDVMNQANYLATHDRDYDLLRIGMHAVHELARQAVAAVDREPDADLLDRIACETWDHYPEHTQQLVDWLEGITAR